MQLFQRYASTTRRSDITIAHGQRKVPKGTTPVTDQQRYICDDVKIDDDDVEEDAFAIIPVSFDEFVLHMTTQEGPLSVAEEVVSETMDNSTAYLTAIRQFMEQDYENNKVLRLGGSNVFLISSQFYYLEDEAGLLKIENEPHLLSVELVDDPRIDEDTLLRVGYVYTNDQ